MIIGTIASSAVYSASAKRVGKLLTPCIRGGNSNSQGVSLSNTVSQSSSASTSATGSPISGDAINTNTSTQINNTGNVFSSPG